MELVVAEQKACALVSYQEDMAEKVRVLLKNGKENTYASLFVCSGDAYTVDGNNPYAASLSAFCASIIP